MGFFTVFVVLLYNSLRLFVEKIQVEVPSFKKEKGEGASSPPEGVQLVRVVALSSPPSTSLGDVGVGVVAARPGGGAGANSDRKKCGGPAVPVLAVWIIDYIFYAVVLVAFCLATAGTLCW